MDRDAILAQVRQATLIESSVVSDANIVTLINQGMHEISLASQWPWLEASETLSAVADAQTYALPTSFDFMVAIVDDDNDTTVPYLAPSEFFRRFGNDTGNTTTTPNYYTIWEDLIYITPIPSTNDTDRFTCYYYKAVTTLSAGPSEPVFHDAFHYMLVEYCKWKLWETQEYFDQSERAFVTFARYLSQMIAWYQRRQKRVPFIAGDGDTRFTGRDPNIPFLGAN